MGSTGRSSAIQVSPAWLDLLRERTDALTVDGKSVGVVQLGKMLADAVGRRTPFSKATVSRFLLGDLITEEMLQAFSKLFDLPYPVITANSIEEIEWFDLGRLVFEADSKFARETMMRLRSWALAEREKNRVREHLFPSEKK